MKPTIHLVFLFLLFSNTIQAQLEVTVLDAATEKPLAFANLYLLKNNKGNATDLNGKAMLEFQEEKFTVDSLKCSYLGYTDKYISVNLNKSEPIIIKLSPSFIPLKAIDVVEQAEKLSGLDLIKLAIKNIKNNYPQEPTHMHFFYREKLTENDSCIEMTEALGKINSVSYTHLTLPTILLV